MAGDVVKLQSVGAWQFFQDMLRDMTTVVAEDAESERERIEGLRAIARISGLCARLLAYKADSTTSATTDGNPLWNCWSTDWSTKPGFR